MIEAMPRRTASLNVDSILYYLPPPLALQGVPEDSCTPTYALCTLHIENDRWQGVPFMLKAGKVGLSVLHS